MSHPPTTHLLCAAVPEMFFFISSRLIVCVQLFLYFKGECQRYLLAFSSLLWLYCSTWLVYSLLPELNSINKIKNK